MFNKSEVASIFVNFKTLVKKQFSHHIKLLRTDGGMEYLNYTLRNFLQQHGIYHLISYPYTPEQNDVVERKHRHIIETTRTLLHIASIPYSYWTEAVLTATYLINRMPSKNTNNISLFQLLFNTSASYDHPRTFGCECFPLLPNHLSHKF